MKKSMGLWIDHREAIIVSLINGKEESSRVLSNSGKHVRYSGSAHASTPEGLKEVTAEDQRDRKFDNDLNAYYDGLVSLLNEADSILIFGPGEAKGELVKRLDLKGHKDQIMTIETEDKMTERQISAKVRDFFSN